MAGVAGLEPVTSAVTGQRSNQLSYTPAMGDEEPRRSAWQRQGLVRNILLREYNCEARYENPGSRRQGGGGGEPR